MKHFKMLLLAVVIVLRAAAGASGYTIPQIHDFVDTEGRTPVDCKSVVGEKTMVALVFGQSNSANFGETAYQPSSGKVFSYFDGECYVAADPMLGADGYGGSVWTRLGDKVVASGMYDRVLFISVGVGGTPMRRWSPPNGDLYTRVVDVLRQLRDDNIKITHVLWHQGESDNVDKTKKKDYKAMFMAMVEDMRKRGVDAPVYVSVATICGVALEGPEIQYAQRELVDPKNNIFPGPYTDEITGKENRHDNCHFSTAGLEKHAEMWLDAIKFSKE